MPLNASARPFPLVDAAHEAPPRRCARARGLVSPPTALQAKRVGCDLNAPMTKWSRLQSFNSESECEDRLSMMKNGQPYVQRRGFGGLHYRIMNSFWVPSDDSRLKSIEPVPFSTAAPAHLAG